MFNDISWLLIKLDTKEEGEHICLLWDKLFIKNRDDNNRGDNNRGDSFPNKREPYNNNNNTGRPTFGGRDNRDRQEMGDRTAFIARTLPTDQQRTVAENKFSQFVETTPDDMEARRRISIAIMANFSKNENSHAVLIFFNKLSGLNKDIVTLSQAHYAIAIKEQLKLGEEAAALKNYETMKKKMVLRQMREWLEVYYSSVLSLLLN